MYTHQVDSTTERQSARMSKITNGGLTQSGWHRILYSCTHMATVGVKALTELHRPPLHKTVQTRRQSHVLCRDVVEILRLHHDVLYLGTNVQHYVARLGRTTHQTHHWHLPPLSAIGNISVTGHELQLGRVHTDTSTSPATCVRVIVNTNLHVFQSQPFTIVRVLYMSTSCLEI